MPPSGPLPTRSDPGAPPAEARPLLALPPAEFAAARDALARALAARGDPAAPAVRKVRRPVGLAWVLNRLARAALERAEAEVRRRRAEVDRAEAASRGARARLAEAEAAAARLREALGARERGG